MVKEKTEKVVLHRPYYSLREVEELTAYKVLDLLHMAAEGKLLISVIADGWLASRVYEIDHSIDIEENGFSVSYRGPEVPDFPTGDDENFVDKVVEWQHGQERQDVVVHNLVSYGRRGLNGWWYGLNPEGPATVAASSIAEFLIRPDTAHIEIDINTWKNIADPFHQRFFRPDPEVLVKDALQADRLVLLTADLERLRGGDKGLVAEKPDGAVSRKTLLKLVIGMAIGGYRYDPQAKRHDCMGPIEKRLHEVNLPVGQDTIRKALEEASQLLPQNPQKS